MITSTHTTSNRCYKTPYGEVHGMVAIKKSADVTSSEADRWEMPKACQCGRIGIRAEELPMFAELSSDDAPKGA